MAQQRAHLVTAQHPPAATVRHRDCAPIGIGVVRDHDIRTRLLRQLQSQVHGSGLLRVGEGHRGKHRVRFRLCPNRNRRLIASSRKRRQHRFGAHSVHRGVHHSHPTGRVRSHDSCRVPHIRVEDRLLDLLPTGLGPRHIRDGHHVPDLGSDQAIDRRHDLRPVAHIDLVAVVLRWVVTGRHHDPSVRAEEAHGIRKDGRGQRARHQRGPPTSRDDHRARVAGKDIGIGPRVIAHHDKRLVRQRLQVCREAGCRADDHRAVHPVRAGAQGPTQTGRPELEQPAHSVCEVLRRSQIPTIGSGDDRLHLGRRHRIGIVGSPKSSGRHHRREHRLTARD